MARQIWAPSPGRVRGTGVLGCFVLSLLLLVNTSLKMFVHALAALSIGSFVVITAQVVRNGRADFPRLSIATTCSISILGILFLPLSIVCASSRKWCFALDLCLDEQPWCGASHNGLTWFGVSNLLLTIAALRFANFDSSIQWTPFWGLTCVRVVERKARVNKPCQRTDVGATAPADSQFPPACLDANSARVKNPPVLLDTGSKCRQNAQPLVAHRSKDTDNAAYPTYYSLNGIRVTEPMATADRHTDNDRRLSKQQVDALSGAGHRPLTLQHLLHWAGVTLCVVWLTQVWLRASPHSTTTAPGDAVLTISGAYTVVVGMAGVVPSWRFGTVWAAASAALLLATQGPQKSVGLFIFGPPPAAMNVDLCSLERLTPRGGGVMSADGSIGVGKVWNNEWWPDCFNRAPCGASPDDFRVYVYPDSAVRDDMASTTRGGLSHLIKHDHRFASTLNAIRDLPYVTLNPAEACILVPSLHTHGVFSRGLFQFLLTQSLRALPTWNEGRNHLLIGDTKDDGCTEPWVDYAMVQRSAWSKSCFRPAFDSTLLLVPHDHRTASKYSWDVWVHRAAVRLRHQVSAGGGRKRYEAFFKGSCYTDKHRTREILHRFVHDPTKGMIAQCTDLPALAGLESGTEASRDRISGLRSGKSTTSAIGSVGYETENWSYEDMLRNSTFCLLPKGHGSHSFRMFEAMLSGCIPVLLTDDLVLPWEDLLPWQKVSVRVPQSLAQDIATELQQIPDAAVRAMQRNILLMVEGIGRVESQVNLTMASLQNRIYGKSTVQRHLSPELLELIAA